MTIYRLDETPDTFISANFDQGLSSYRMFSIKGESNCTFIRDIDLKKDVLIIYGTEIKESVWEKLRNSLLLRQNAGKIYVDCNGGCYIYMIEKKVLCRPVDNVVFDWSLFGVIVPNSVNDLLRKQQLQKDQELSAMSNLLASVKGEASANKEGWEASRQEVEKLTNQLSACRKKQLGNEMELQKVRSQLSVEKFEMEATKIKFEFSKEEVKELRNQVYGSNKTDYKNMEMELQTVQHQLSSTISELKSIRSMWEFSKEQLFSSKKENEDLKVKLQSLQDQVSSVVAELQSTKIELASNKNMEKLEPQLFSCRKEYQDAVTELQKVKDELSSSKFELQLAKSELESSHKKINELQEQLSTTENVQDQLYLIMNELQSIKILVDFTSQKDVELED